MTAGVSVLKLVSRSSSMKTTTTRKIHKKASTDRESVAGKAGGAPDALKSLQQLHPEPFFMNLNFAAFGMRLLRIPQVR